MRSTTGLSPERPADTSSQCERGKSSFSFKFPLVRLRQKLKQLKSPRHVLLERFVEGLELAELQEVSDGVNRRQRCFHHSGNSEEINHRNKSVASCVTTLMDRHLKKPSGYAAQPSQEQSSIIPLARKAPEEKHESGVLSNFRKNELGASIAQLTASARRRRRTGPPGSSRAGECKQKTSMLNSHSMSPGEAFKAARDVVSRVANHPPALPSP